MGWSLRVFDSFEVRDAYLELKAAQEAYHNALLQQYAAFQEAGHHPHARLIDRKCLQLREAPKL